MMLDFTEGLTIDSRRLLYFYHVAKSGSFSKAEAALNAPQPAISRHISKLEEELGVKLLDRNGRGVTLTRFGEILLRHATPILEEMSATVQDLESARHEPSEQLRIAAPATMMALYMPEVIRRFAKANPTVELMVLQALTGDIYGMLVSGRIDIGIVETVPNKAKFIEKNIFVEPLVAVTGKNHPLAAKTSISRKLLARQRLVLPSLSHGLRATIDAYLSKEKLDHIDIPFQVDSIPLIKELVADGSLMSVLPQSTCLQYFDTKQFRVLALEPSVKRSLSLAYPREGRSAYALDFSDLLIDVVTERNQAVSA